MQRATADVDATINVERVCVKMAGRRAVIATAVDQGWFSPNEEEAKEAAEEAAPIDAQTIEWIETVFDQLKFGHVLEHMKTELLRNVDKLRTFTRTISPRIPIDAIVYDPSSETVDDDKFMIEWLTKLTNENTARLGDESLPTRIYIRRLRDAIRFDYTPTKLKRSPDGFPREGSESPREGGASGGGGGGMFPYSPDLDAGGAFLADVHRGADHSVRHLCDRIVSRVDPMKKFQRYLEHNLTRRCSPADCTLIEAYKHGDPTRLMAFMDFTRRTKVEWWAFTDQAVSIWVTFRGQFESIHVTDADAHVQSISTSILPYVREIERNQVQLQMLEPNIAFCTSCYHMRTENEVLRAKVEELSGRAPEPAARLDREILRKWFSETFHTNGYGRGYPRKQMRKELNEYLATIYGYKTEIYSTSELWKWFVDEVIGDRSSQYRGFRIWKKTPPHNDSAPMQLRGEGKAACSNALPENPQVRTPCALSLQSRPVEDASMQNSNPVQSGVGLRAQDSESDNRVLRPNAVRIGHCFIDRSAAPRSASEQYAGGLATSPDAGHRD